MFKADAGKVQHSPEETKNNVIDQLTRCRSSL